MERKKTFRLALLGFTFVIAGAFIGIQLSDQVSQNSAEETLSTYPVDLSMAGLHRHDLRNVPAEEAPSLDLEVEEDPMMPGHFILHIRTENFEFAPENVSEEFVMGEGHAHVFVDDVKISRAFSEYYHLPRLDPGEHTISVSLNTNNHQEYAVNGESLMAFETVTVSEEAGKNMSR